MQDFQLNMLTLPLPFSNLQFTGDGSKQEFVVYVIAIPANRYDLLCLEGFARALRIFLGLEKSPVRVFCFSIVNASYIFILILDIPTFRGNK